MIKAASDAFELLNALDELSVATMDEITDIGREAESLIDRIVFDERYP